MNASLKRNRSGNFTNEELEMLLNLVEEHKNLVDSGKQEDKKKGWEMIHDAFNTHFSTSRDISVLRMKLKNFKAHSKRSKTGSEAGDGQDSDDNETSITDGNSGTDTKQKTPRKRGKLFATEETLLLQELVEQHIESLDTSLSRESLDNRQKAWEALTEEFNKHEVANISRDIAELKIKYKNMKAQRSNDNYKTEHILEQQVVHIISQDNTISKGRVISQTSQNDRIMTNSVESPSKNRSYDVLLETIDQDYDFIEEEEYSPPAHKSNGDDDKEMERIRKENLLLKNSVLRKKERLLELQISLAERNLRRHQL